MAKCSVCNGCIEPEIINNIRYLRCSFCRRYYLVVNNELVDVTETLRQQGII